MGGDDEVAIGGVVDAVVTLSLAGATTFTVRVVLVVRPL
jgi:hypothetical protein